MTERGGRRLAVSLFSVTVAALFVLTVLLIVDRAHLNPQKGDAFFYASSGSRCWRSPPSAR